MRSSLADRFTEMMGAAYGRNFRTSIGNAQVEELHRAFMGGVAVAFFGTLNLAALPDADAEWEMQETEKEIRDYFKLLGQMPPGAVNN